MRVRVQASEPVEATVRLAAGAAAEERSLGQGASLFDQAFRVMALPAGAEATAVVVVVDLAGHRGESEQAGFRVPAAPTVALAITEVMVNPAGAETSQEYVEVRNLGQSPVALDGLAIEDEGGRDPLPQASLSPGAVALVVGAAFDEASAADVPPRPATALLRVPGRIGRDGLRQQGEAVRLVTADGTVVSSYGGYVDTSRTAWNGRSIHRQPDPAACDHPQSWSMAPQDPTPGW